jgi:hypothetical protein
MPILFFGFFVLSYFFDVNKTISVPDPKNFVFVQKALGRIWDMVDFSKMGHGW